MKTRITALLLVLVMVFGMLPAAAFASPVDMASEEGTFDTAELTVAAEKNSTLAPGVTQDAYTLYNNKDEQVRMWVTTADMNVDTVKLFASYKDMDPTNYGMSKLTEQVAFFNEKVAAGDEYYQGTVVAGINASYYNMTTGKPTGTFVMNGIDVTTESEGNNYGYFAVMKDGSVKIGNKGDYSKDKGNIQEAIGIYTMLIVDGKICSGLNTVQYYPRQTIGITADGKVILMTADGNQAPRSVGLTVQEQAEVMLDLGCVWAGHLDGGGSCTYASKAEGSNEFSITNSPSDGSERSVSNGFIIVSTAVSDGKFNSATLTPESEYVTPGSTVAISAMGVDKAGGPAEIPENAVLSATKGTIENDKFISDGTVGDAVITMTVDGMEVGSAVIHVVVPDSIEFGSSATVVPYGKSITLSISAKYGARDVVLKASDLSFTFSDSTIGTLSGMEFTAGEEGVAGTSSMLTATLVHDTSKTATMTISLGKGSEVVYDFEDGTAQNVVINETPGTRYNYVWPETQQEVVTAEDGKVHSGDYALKMTVDYSNSLESGYMRTSLYATETRTFENAVGVGAWLYIPDEMVGLWVRWTLRSVTGYNEDGTPIYGSSVNSNTMDDTAGGTGIVYTFDEPGWHYLYADTSAYDAVGWVANGAMMQFYISDRDGAEYNYTAADHSNIPSKYVLYLDDITVDYSTAVDDRYAPKFSNVTYATEGMPDAAVLNGNTITSNKVTIAAAVADNTKGSNVSGLDVATVKAYIDGVEVDCSYANGKVSIDDAVLTNGKHTIKFSACDNMGNYGYVYQYITVNAETSGSTVKLVPSDASLNRIKLSSIYNMDLVATAIEEVKSVEVVIDLDNNSIWELDHMTPAEGFTASYTIDSDENIATIIITRTGENTQTGEAALATLPIRVWTLKTGYIYPNGTKAGQQALTLKQFRNIPEFWKMSVIANVDMGVLNREDNTSDTFTGEGVFCDTEMWFTATKMDATNGASDYYKTWNGGHVHSAVALDDKDATCTESGYVDRTYCEGCASVVEWGETLDATGHFYDFVDGVLKCECGELFNGVYTDGKTYVNGLLIADGWSGECYYVNGVVLTGVQLIDGKYYNFGEDGICSGKRPMSDEWWTNDNGEHFYMVDGVPATGYRFMYPNPVFFYENGVAFDGEIEINGEICVFDKAAFVESTTADVLLAGLAGPKAYFILYADGTFVLTGEGETYSFVGIGNTYPPNISWKNRPWGKNTALSNSIKKIVVGKDITEIGDYYFYQCYNVSEVTFEEDSALTKLNKFSLMYLTGLKELILPDSLKIIEGQALAYNGKLTNVYIPQGTNSIATNTFKNSNKVILNVAEGSYGQNYAEKNNVQHTVRPFTEGIVAQGSCGTAATWTLYESGRLVIDGSGAMADYANKNAQPWAAYRSQIYTVEIGKDITHIGKFAFAYAYDLKSVTFEEGSKLESIGSIAFFYSLELRELILPETVKSIDAQGIAYNRKLTNVFIPQGTTSIANNAFLNSKWVVLNVAEGSYAEKYAEKNGISYTTREFIERVIAEGTCGINATWTLYESGRLVIGGTGAMADYANKNAQPWASYRNQIYSVEIGRDITHIGNFAFAYAYNLETVTFEENSKLESIGSVAFFYSLELKELILPETVKSIAAQGIAYNSKLTNVYIPQGTNSIAKNAFLNSKKVVLNVAEGSYAENYAVKNSIAHTTRAFVENVVAEGVCGANATWVLYESGRLVIDGSGAMADYANKNEQPWASYRNQIYTVEIGKDITHIGKFAFAYAYNLAEVDFQEGSKLQSIGSMAIFYSLELKELILPETVKHIAAQGVGYNSKLTNVYIPEHITYIASKAFMNSNKVVLNVAKGSYAENYAVSNGIAYVTR